MGRDRDRERERGGFPCEELAAAVIKYYVYSVCVCVCVWKDVIK